MASRTRSSDSAHRRGPIDWLRRNGVMIFAAFAIAYTLIPIVVVAVFSFGASESGFLTFGIDGFTTEFWRSAFTIDELNDALLTSIKLAALSTIASTILGTLMAIALVRHQFLGRRLTNLLIVLPMATPEVVIGASLLSMFIIYSVTLGFTTLFIAHVMFSISFVVVVVRSRLIGFDRSLEDAAADLGAGPLTKFRTVTLPLLAPGILSAALLAFALSLDDFVISNFNSGTTSTFPLYIYGVALRGIPVQVNVLATLLFLLTLVALGLVLWQQRRAEKLASVGDADEKAFALAPARPTPGASAS